mmetsp:Transcript_42253/g.135225  ORF Transcript_42253/g.135225 Transcript_42253/m.135225 type:complete len:224 (-) Transcript_42253:1469-2140(-)
MVDRPQDLHFSRPDHVQPPRGLPLLVHERIRGEGAALEPRADLDLHHLRLVGEERNHVDHIAVGVEHDALAEHVRHLVKEVLIGVCLDLLHPEVVHALLPVVPRQLVVPDELHDALHLLGVRAAADVPVGDHLGDHGDDQREHEAPRDHAHDGGDALGHRHGGDVPVPHGGHGGVGPVHHHRVLGEKGRVAEFFLGPKLHQDPRRELIVVVGVDPCFLRCVGV